MPLSDVIRAVTSTPAKAMGLGHVIGSLTPGKEADITVLKIHDGQFPMEDSQSQVSKAQRYNCIHHSNANHT